VLPKWGQQFVVLQRGSGQTHLRASRTREAPTFVQTCGKPYYTTWADHFHPSWRRSTAMDNSFEEIIFKLYNFFINFTTNSQVCQAQ